MNNQQRKFIEIAGECFDLYSVVAVSPVDLNEHNGIAEFFIRLDGKHDIIFCIDVEHSALGEINKQKANEIRQTIIKALKKIEENL